MGISARLITPKIGCKWTQTNKIFRSSIWDLEGNLLSASFPRFSNLGETPEVFPPPKSLINTQIVSKIDGSAAIFDVINNKISVRTRGTFSYETLDNANDFRYVLDKRPNILPWLRAMGNYSLICEITTPNQQIILKYSDKPELHLIGLINKEDYYLSPQNHLDEIGKRLGIQRPEYYNANNLDELVSFVKPRKDIEGICLYSTDNGIQYIHKVKADWYLKLHKLKSDLSSFDKVVDLFLSFGCPDYEKFYSIIEQTFDYELAQFCKENLESCCVQHQRVTKVLAEIKEKVLTLADLPRKNAALEIIRLFKEDGLSSIAFQYLNKKAIDNDNIKELIIKHHKMKEINKRYDYI